MQPVNVVPSFTKGPDIVVLQNSGPHIVPGWATNISPGPANEAGQALEFTTTTDNGALFSASPQITPDGTLTFTSAHNRSGKAVVSLVLKDNGGTAFGGQDTSPPQTFRIAVLSPCEAVQRLVQQVQAANLGNLSRPLLAPLEAACSAFYRGDWLAGIRY